MNPIFSRTLKSLCTVAVVALLSACGASSTVDPFHPKRVIGLGDAYNDVGSDGSGNAPFTVRGTSEVATVVEHVAALFNVGSDGTFKAVQAGFAPQSLASTGVFSYAAGGALINSGSNSLADQIKQLDADVGHALNSSDLIVVAAGTQDIKATYSLAGAETAAGLFAAQIQKLLEMGAKHVLILQPLELSLTPYAIRNRTTYPVNDPLRINVESNNSPTVKFNSVASGVIFDYVSRRGLSYNPVIYGAGLQGTFSSTFNFYTSQPQYMEFTTSTQVPYCSGADAIAMAGCTQTLNNPSVYDTTLFADDLNLTPLGNRWVASNLYNATSQGWR